MGEQPSNVRSRHFTLTITSLVGLVAGVAAGIVVYVSQNSALISLTSFVEPLGVLWTNALRMVILPLVISSLIVGIASVPNPRTVVRLGGLSLLVFVILLAIAAVFGLLTARPLIARLSVNPEAFRSLGTGTTSTSSDGAEEAKNSPTIVQSVIDLVPTNPFKAASDGAILPLIVFIILFALAITRLKPEHYQLLISFFQAINEATLILVRWILLVAPIGIFALAFSFIARSGFALVGALGYFVILSCALLLALTLLLYVIVALFGKVSLSGFAQAVAPAQLVALTSRSSLASLPALIDGAEKKLKLPSVITGFVLPLSVSTFKINRAISSPVKFLFLARLYGIDLSFGQIAAFIALAMILSFSTPGIPGAGSVRTIPAYLAAGIPIEAVLLFNAVVPIIDVFDTLANVTADMTAAALVARSAGVSATTSPLSSDSGDESAHGLQQSPALSEG